MKNLHCCYDEKFIDGAISLFDSDFNPNVENTYVVVSDKPILHFSHIKNKKVINVLSSDFISYICDFDVIILHSLFALPNFSLISSIPREKKVVWFSWGWDTYSDFYPVIPTKLYEKRTLKNMSFQERIGIMRFRVKYWCKLKKLHKSAINRVDFYSGVFPYEYDLIKKYVPCFNAKPLDFYYGSTDFFIPNIPSFEYNPNDKVNLLIGNSAVPTNNHLDILNYLRNNDTTSWKKIIIPLSYGGTESYKKVVIDEGVSLFGDRMMPLQSFMPLDKYTRIMSNCKTAIFFHNRQQASDNVFLQMIYGARVFMSNKNLMFQYLKSKGLKIYSLQDDAKLLTEPMEVEDVLINRKYLSENYSSNSLISRITEINKILIKAIK